MVDASSRKWGNDPSLKGVNATESMKKRHSGAQKTQLQKQQMRKNHFNVEFFNGIGRFQSFTYELETTWSDTVCQFKSELLQLM